MIRGQSGGSRDGDQAFDWPRGDWVDVAIRAANDLDVISPNVEGTVEREFKVR